MAYVSASSQLVTSPQTHYFNEVNVSHSLHKPRTSLTQGKRHRNEFFESGGEFRQNVRPKRRKIAEQDTRNFACPFFKYDPYKFGPMGCAEWRTPDVHRVYSVRLPDLYIFL